MFISDLVFLLDFLALPVVPKEPVDENPVSHGRDKETKESLFFSVKFNTLCIKSLHGFTIIPSA